MAKQKAMGTGERPLAFAAKVSQAANAAFQDGHGPMMETVTPVTRSPSQTVCSTSTKGRARRY